MTKALKSKITANLPIFFFYISLIFILSSANCTAENQNQDPDLVNIQYIGEEIYPSAAVITIIPEISKYLADEDLYIYLLVKYYDEPGSSHLTQILPLESGEILKILIKGMGSAWDAGLIPSTRYIYELRISTEEFREWYYIGGERTFTTTAAGIARNTAVFIQEPEIYPTQAIIKADIQVPFNWTWQIRLYYRHNIEGAESYSKSIYFTGIPPEFRMVLDDLIPGEPYLFTIEILGQSASQWILYSSSSDEFLTPLALEATPPSPIFDRMWVNLIWIVSGLGLGFYMMKWGKEWGLAAGLISTCTIGMIVGGIQEWAMYGLDAWAYFGVLFISASVLVLFWER